MNKNILLCMPDHYGIYRCIIKNLEFYNFCVTSAVRSSNMPRFVYPSLWIRIKTKYQQLILKNKSAKQALKDKIENERLLSLLQSAAPIDWALFIRGDIYSQDFVKAASDIAKNGSINYQWDGMNRYPSIQMVKSNFNRFYVFNPQDNQNINNVLPASNFYFDYPIQPTKASSDFYFIGADLPDRRQIIADFGKLAKQKNWKLNFQICLENEEAEKNVAQIYPDNITLSRQLLDFETNIQQAKASKILVDFVNSHHTGLSFRIFEALGYNKKLITTNLDVAKYDFYHPNNIFIWNGKNLDGIEDFFNLPYIKPAQEIYEKYSFGNWIKYILDIPPYQKITLPNS